MRAALDGIDHALQGRLGIGAAGGLVQRARQGRSEHDGPVVAGGSELAGLFHQGTERGQLLWGFVHTHQRHQGAALPGFKARALGGGGIVGQFNRCKHKQKTLGFGLHARGLQQIVEAGNIHGKNLAMKEVGKGQNPGTTPRSASSVLT